ncbi:Uncharacterised protein [Mycobacteroides abscessus subsp. abscessus]|nr:Uncharacterised protein [Mycobacteroides abscessus subsp. abscessus]
MLEDNTLLPCLGASGNLSSLNNKLIPAWCIKADGGTRVLQRLPFLGCLRNSKIGIHSKIVESLKDSFRNHPVGLCDCFRHFRMVL